MRREYIIFSSALRQDGRKCALENRKAEGYVDTGVKILIAVVLGALVLSLLYALINGTVMPKVTEKVNGIFSYTA